MGDLHIRRLHVLHMLILLLSKHHNLLPRAAAFCHDKLAEAVIINAILSESKRARGQDPQSM